LSRSSLPIALIQIPKDHHLAWLVLAGRKIYSQRLETSLSCIASLTSVRLRVPGRISDPNYK
jgi:hypothetical protein